MSNDKIAFFIGLFGSVHCIGMCGPLAFAIPVAYSRSWLWLLWDKLIYNLGRTFSYCFLGLLTGLLGKQLWLAGLQQWISIGSGIFITLAAFSRLLKISTTGIFPKNNAGGLNRLLSYALKHQWGHLFIGMLNGFLPCGFVYLALAGALNTGNALAAGQYMFWFGMGTLPLMLLAMVSSGFISRPFRNRVNRVVPYVMLLLGVWFVLRGLNLNIPYLSAPKATTAVSICR